MPILHRRLVKILLMPQNYFQGSENPGIEFYHTKNEIMGM
jgi:hypothetical protein